MNHGLGDFFKASTRPATSSLVGLPLPPVASGFDPSSSIYCVLATVDQRGRLSSASVTRRLGWQSEQLTSIRVTNANVIIVAPDDHGRHSLTKAGHIRLPVNIRRQSHLDVRDQLLIVVMDGRDQAAIYTMPILWNALQTCDVAVWTQAE